MTLTCPRCGAEREADSACPDCGAVDDASPWALPSDEALLERVEQSVHEAAAIARSAQRRVVGDGRGPQLPPRLAERLRRQAVLLRDELAAHERAIAALAAAIRRVERALERSGEDEAPRPPLVDVRLPRIHDAAELARRHVHSRLAPVIDAEATADAALIVAELVENARVHGRGVISLRALALADRLRVEVSDEGSPAWPAVLEGVDGGTGGWGLWIVARRSMAWGVDERTALVWAEVPLRRGGH
ncbi:MAG TPA: ATP-binding protein [Solirubrobacteraceae bacterium]|nr:ATP-binding protein [Solirubrobacteraceae bacterium]